MDSSSYIKLRSNVTKLWAAIGFLILSACLFQCTNRNENALKIKKDAHIILIGNNLGSRMMDYGYFETEMQLRYPDSTLYIRNMSDGGNTPGFRPHSGHPSPWAFPGAEKFQTELANDPNTQGHFEMPDEWLTRHKADIIVAFFGSVASFDGEAGVQRYKDELDAFVKYTLQQRYNGVSAPQLALVSPIAFEDLSAKYDLPDGKTENEHLSLYTQAMKEVADSNQVLFVDMYTPFKKLFDKGDQQWTIDGLQLNDEGYKKFSLLLADAVFGNEKVKDDALRKSVHAAVMEKNWMWHKDFKMPNGVQAYGRRYDPFGPDNYPAEIAKIREMTAIRDEAIWKAVKGERFNLDSADALTTKLPEVKTNYVPSGKNGVPRYLYGEEALSKFRMAPGYKIELFASEEEFPELEKPMQMSFDNQGRLWVAIMPTYPHWKPGDPKPNDKILIFEDTDNDGKADKQTVFADSLHLPVGFEIAPEGVYVSQGTNFVLLTDTDGDGKADKKEVLLSGFDDHDTHHAHHAYTTDPSGAIYMGTGVFLISDIETPYGTVRTTNGGFFRYDPNRRKLEFAQLSIPNPWGITFDDWGQNFYAETSGPAVSWMMPGTVKPIYGIFTPKSRNLVEAAHQVRPTSGLEFISSRHFPDDVQGDYLINNTIGFLGTKEHTLEDDGTGYKSHHRQDLLRSEDPNFRPVDLEFAPDGSLYVIDWHNVLIGHMQHNQRDPLRDHTHGRIYRVTYPSRPLVKPAYIADAPIDTLLDNLKLPEYRSRYRTRRELRGRDSSEVLAHLKTWVKNLDKNDPRYEHHLLEGLWVSWGLNRVDQQLLRQLLHANDFRVRAAAVRVVRYTGHQVADQAQLLKEAAGDEHGRVRLEALVAASWLDKEPGLAILEEAAKKPLDDWMADAYGAAFARLNGDVIQKKKAERTAKTDLKGKDLELFKKGQLLYAQDGFCETCHQADGKGLPSSGFPPLAGSPWLDSDDRLIKLTLKGMQGPMELLGHKYPGQVPMTPFGGLLNDEEVAAVLTYVKNSFGNTGTPVNPEKVKAIRAAIADKKGFYHPEELLKEHPLSN
ncbi:PVC-type heme-binding CxxCH protein [Parapedobacter indicus]|uniref:Putative membrane-bound dehydrogenase domain-containing protein n=1 Tax=Parapedobacter indicus TaxID=1477437 RepID=A0A1I3FAU4_9SPHI|nr:PVC-type heme-binding CxxCH protein [Parapedobacter indicus]PPL03633.1 putative membrane-bound dehydrogenase-like protein [Parapedobacter indicus]SFI08260.1 putative membrane-bound dehydrogenase domain-containing protein [Parapedobacter indicus]